MHETHLECFSRDNEHLKWCGVINGLIHCCGLKCASCSSSCFIAASCVLCFPVSLHAVLLHCWSPNNTTSWSDHPLKFFTLKAKIEISNINIVSLKNSVLCSTVEHTSYFPSADLAFLITQLNTMYFYLHEPGKQQENLKAVTPIACPLYTRNCIYVVTRKSPGKSWSLGIYKARSYEGD